jgi:hypothetical protein
MCMSHKSRGKTGKHMRTLDLLSPCINTGTDGFGQICWLRRERKKEGARRCLQIDALISKRMHINYFHKKDSFNEMNGQSKAGSATSINIALNRFQPTEPIARWRMAEISLWTVVKCQCFERISASDGNKSNETQTETVFALIDGENTSSSFERIPCSNVRHERVCWLNFHCKSHRADESASPCCDCLARWHCTRLIDQCLIDRTSICSLLNRFERERETICRRAQRASWPSCSLIIEHDNVWFQSSSPHWRSMNKKNRRWHFISFQS